jgi:hypothetical protein
VDWSAFNRRANAWMLRHPWRYAGLLGGLMGTLWFILNFFGSRAFGRPKGLLYCLLYGLGLGLAWFLMWGWAVPRLRRNREPRDDTPAGRKESG